MNNGGPAFPQPATSEGYAANSPFAVAGGGMTLRDWFAGTKRLTAMEEKLIERMVPDIKKRCDFESTLRYVYADSMLSAREPST